MDLARSASIPMTVLPSEATNSSGAYVASAATRRPAVLTEVGTVAASVESLGAVGTLLDELALAAAPALSAPLRVTPARQSAVAPDRILSLLVFERTIGLPMWVQWARVCHLGATRSSHQIAPTGSGDTCRPGRLYERRQAAHRIAVGTDESADAGAAEISAFLQFSSGF